jgi:plastocyanin
MPSSRHVTLRAALTAGTLGAATAVTLSAVILPGRALGVTNTVAIDNFTFNPQHTVVKMGTTVTWTNKDDIPHAVAAANKLFKSKALDTDDNYSFTFATPGTYEYFCSIHPHMTGTIVVEAATGNDAAH